MDNAEYLIERHRMCEAYARECKRCQLGRLEQCVYPEDMETAVLIVEKWKMDMTVLEIVNGWMKRLYGGGEDSG